MAKRYSELVHDLWSGHHKSITPLKFRVSNIVDIVSIKSCVVFSSQTCPSIQQLPTAGCPGAIGVLIGRTTRGLEQGQGEAIS